MKYICNSCLKIYEESVSFCDQCGSTSVFEEVQIGNPKYIDNNAKFVLPPVWEPDTSPEANILLRTGFAEIDDIVGGFLPEHITLLHGPAGGCKTSFALQIAEAYAGRVGPDKVLYVSSEMTERAVNKRMQGLEINNSFRVTHETEIMRLDYAIRQVKPLMLIVDSYNELDYYSLMAGSIKKLTLIMEDLISISHEMGCMLWVVSHETEAGNFRGSNTIDHKIDTRLRVETHPEAEYYKILSVKKNRHGPSGTTQNVHIFKVVDGGRVVPCQDISHLADFSDKPGCAMGGFMLGKRPFFPQVEATRTGAKLESSNSGSPTLSPKNVLRALYAVRSVAPTVPDVSVIVSTSKDCFTYKNELGLSICAAMLSEYTGKKIPEGIVFVGDVSTKGSVRSVQNTDYYIRCAAQMGFKQIIIATKETLQPNESIEVNVVSDVADIMWLFE